MVTDYQIVSFDLLLLVQLYHSISSRLKFFEAHEAIVLQQIIRTVFLNLRGGDLAKLLEDFGKRLFFKAFGKALHVNVITFFVIQT